MNQNKIVISGFFVLAIIFLVVVFVEETDVNNSPDGHLANAIYGPVQEGETILEIAESLRSELNALSLHTIVYAIFEENREAFSNNNIFELIDGSVLEIGDLEALKLIDNSYAKEFYLSQIENNAESVIRSDNKVESEDVDVFQVGASQDADVFAYNEASDSEDAEKIALRDEANELKDALSASELENQELIARISILEDQLDDINRLLELSIEDTELASVEVELNHQNDVGLSEYWTSDEGGLSSEDMLLDEESAPSFPQSDSSPSIYQRFVDFFIKPTSQNQTVQNKKDRDEKFGVVSVFYATDRAPDTPLTNEKRYFNDLNSLYSNKRNSATTYGIAEVSIPKHKHKEGTVERPSIFRFEFNEDPEKHIVIRSIKVKRIDSFISSAIESLDETGDLFVFVHGFNVSFTESLRRTAQLSYDLGTPGLPIAYSWPSQGRSDPVAYMTDRNFTSSSFRHLKEFLVELSTKTKSSNIHLLAHSMGNEVLTKAIAELDDDLILNEVVLAAPDIDSRAFTEVIAPKLSNKAQRYTLYASSNDKALIASKEFQEGARLGLAGNDLVVMNGIDTIDASVADTSILGHSYYGDESKLINDLYHLFHNHLKPDSRNLEPKSKNGMTYWSLKE